MYLPDINVTRTAAGHRPALALLRRRRTLLQPREPLAACISLGGVVALEAVRVGAFDIDNAIQGYGRREYGIAVGERTAEEIKIVLSSRSEWSRKPRSRRNRRFRSWWQLTMQRTI